jgi:hypothetical protein
VPEEYPPQLAAPAVARRRLLGTLTAWILDLTRLSPVVVVLEDLHWADPSTLELQQALVEQGATARLLILYTARSEFVLPWRERTHVTLLTLNRLRRQHTREMIAGVAARSALVAEVIDLLAARTDGVPLFVEELTKAVVEAGREAATRELPRTLADSLLARIDRLGAAAKTVAQVDAVLGREFRHDVLHAMQPTRHEELPGAIEKLVQAELLNIRGFPPDAVYALKHALVQDAAYASLADDRRRALHGRAAAVLSAEHPALAEDHPEVLAQHHSEAGEDEAAVRAWQRAGDHALRRGALSEAEAHLRRELDMLARLPETEERAERELPLQLALAYSLAFRRGLTAPETVGAWARARDICQRIGDPQHVCWFLFSAWVPTLAQEGPMSALPLAEELMNAAKRSGSPWWLEWAHVAAGATRFHAGDHRGAYEHLGLARQYGGAESPRVGPPETASILGVGYEMYAAWHLGEARAARRLAAELAERAKTGSRAGDRGWPHQFRAVLHSTMLGDPERAEADAQQVLATCAAEPNPNHESTARIVLGWARAQQGQLEDGLAMIRAGLDQSVSTAQRLSLGVRLGLLIEALVLAGRTEEALRALDESESACPGEAFLRPLQWCQRAELLERAGAATAEVESAYREGLACAHAQESRAFELRLAVSYARWLRGHDRRAEARDLLSPLCGRLDPDDDARDARAARALLGDS